jgi:hypothetical protein
VVGFLGGLSAGEIDDDFDVVALPSECLLDVRRGYPPRDQPCQPLRVSRRQRLTGPVEMPPVGVDRADDDVVA